MLSLGFSGSFVMTTSSARYTPGSSPVASSRYYDRERCPNIDRTAHRVLTQPGHVGERLERQRIGHRVLEDDRPVSAVRPCEFERLTEGNDAPTAELVVEERRQPGVGTGGDHRTVRCAVERRVARRIPEERVRDAGHQRVVRHRHVVGALEHVRDHSDTARNRCITDVATVPPGTGGPEPQEPAAGDEVLEASCVGHVGVVEPPAAGRSR